MQNGTHTTKPFTVHFSVSEVNVFSLFTPDSFGISQGTDVSIGSTSQCPLQ